MQEMTSKITPMMQQWHECKKQAPDALLFFRLGDFYEAFYEDAEIIAKELELTLTKRQEIPMSGVPWHTAENYIDRLVAKGFKVAIAEQMENPKHVKGIVKRAIVRIVTPGTNLSSTLLSEKNNQFIASVHQVGSLFGLSVADPTTGAFSVEEFEDPKALFNALYRLQPKECLISAKFKERHEKFLQPFYVTLRDEWYFDHQTAYNCMTRHFKVHSLDGFGLRAKVASINAAGALLNYLHEDLSLSIDHIRAIKWIASNASLAIDMTTFKHLDLNDLLETIDRTLTPMGARLLKQWLKNPLLDIREIKKRHDAIEALHASPFSISSLKPLFKQVRDLERLMTKISAQLASPRDVIAFRLSLEQISPIKEALREVKSTLFSEVKNGLPDTSKTIALLQQALIDEPAAKLSEGNIFKSGYDAKLDELKAIARNGKDWLIRYQNEIKQQTGIKSLKIVYNKVFGYTIEVSRGQSKMMPDSFEKRQTLSNCERYTTAALKEYESTVLTAEERTIALEKELFLALLGKLKEQVESIFQAAHMIALTDVFCSLAEVAQLKDYVRPLVDASAILKIVGGRHPVVEEAISRQYFIPNDTHLSNDAQLMLLTGPNMGGKSTYIRQVALIVIMAQMGSFVPALEAHIGVIDRIFTRIGASDDLGRGQSTFMIEMSETANILNNITKNSLVILDEIGRGTSTYDGLSIAWAVAEHLLKTKGAKTLFATHYCELTQLENMQGVCNYHAVVKETQGDVVFMHKIVKGAADKSYGIHVAKLAGLPPSLIERAQDILLQLEGDTARKEKKRRILEQNLEQLTLF